jgi:hypothetical protein
MKSHGHLDDRYLDDPLRHSEALRRVPGHAVTHLTIPHRPDLMYLC